MKAEEIFKSKTKRRTQIFKEWKEAERGKDPLVEYWREKKRRQSICHLEGAK